VAPPISPGGWCWLALGPHGGAESEVAAMAVGMEPLAARKWPRQGVLTHALLLGIAGGAESEVRRWQSAWSLWRRGSGRGRGSSHAPSSLASPRSCSACLRGLLCRGRWVGALPAHARRRHGQEEDLRPGGVIEGVAQP
jgi:hypothetical protein